MVGGSAVLLDHSDLAASLGGGEADHADELVGLSHGRAAGARQQQPARAHALQCRLVEALILVLGALQIVAARRQLGGIENDAVPQPVDTAAACVRRVR
jgi:hypothetical protein